jgi:carbonic anhydrase/acetyltransferase-like protein (isoleucine patch superfamily)
VTHDAANWKAELHIHSSVFVAPGAVVVGEVRLEREASVWFNTVVRGDSAPVRIGERTNLQDLVLVHEDAGLPAIVGARVTVGHRAILHGCVIEDDCLVGMGAVVLSGARIGRGSLIGAGTLVREGQEIPPGSLVVGAPARVVGPVDERHRAAIAEGARHYAALARSYLRRGFSRPHPQPAEDRGLGAPTVDPMTHFEWRERVRVLAEGPARVKEAMEAQGAASWRRRPQPEQWSPVEIVAHLRDADRDVYVPRVERLLRENEPEFAEVDLVLAERVASYADVNPHHVLADWSSLRAGLVRRLEAAGPRDWDRLAFHERRGPVTFADVVRGWTEHDLSHRAQLDRALASLAGRS